MLLPKVLYSKGPASSKEVQGYQSIVGGMATWLSKIGTLTTDGEGAGQYYKSTPFA
jgi:hypothetical protein